MNMNNIRAKLIRFMQGRNGPDDLYKATLWLYLGMLVVNIFVHSVILSVLMWAVFFYGMYRCFSKQTDKRQHENYRYLLFIGKVQRKYSSVKTMLTDKEHYYKKCGGCKNILRLPRIKGNHKTVCPKCGKELNIKIR